MNIRRGTPPPIVPVFSGDPTDEDLVNLATYFKRLAVVKDLHIVLLLRKAAPRSLTVAEVASQLALRQPDTSTALLNLYRLGLVDRESRVYSLITPSTKTGSRYSRMR